MNKLILFQGPPGSGKSHDAKKLASEQNGLVFSTDDFWGKDYSFDKKLLTTAHTWNKGRVEGAMMAGFPLVIIDNTNTTPKEWKPYQDLAKRFGYEVLFRRPTSYWWKAMEESVKNKTFESIDVQTLRDYSRHPVPFNTVLNMLNRFEFGGQ